MRNVILFLFPSMRIKNRMQIALKAILYIQVSLADTCYVFPTDLSDPCSHHACQYGARCVPTPDGRNFTCECPLSCPNYGDHSRSRPVCGGDGLDYTNHCELKKTACKSDINITVKYEGYCGKSTESADSPNLSGHQTNILPRLCRSVQ